MRRQLTIATRGSKLALWQAEHVKNRLIALDPGLSVGLLVLKTQGDKILDVPLAAIGGKGLFVKEIEEALLDGRADLAVHSMKDVPAELPEGLTIGAVPEREDPCDMLLSVHHDGLAGLPQGALVGTSSLRRQAQLKALRPDLRIESLRGNLDTRVKKLMDGEFAAIVVAAAGLNRLGLKAPKSERLEPPRFLPAVAQGALGIECREEDGELLALLEGLDHESSRIRVEAERGFLTALEGGCQVPIAGHAVLEGEDLLRLTGLVCDLDGRSPIRRQAVGFAEDAWDLGTELAEEILEAGGREILDAIYGRTTMPPAAP